MDKLSRTFNDVAITVFYDTRNVFYKMREVGKALGYSSRGGNFSHLVRLDNSAWNQKLHEGIHYAWRARDIATDKGGHTLWLTRAGLSIALSLASTKHNKAVAVKAFSNWLRTDPFGFSGKRKVLPRRQKRACVSGINT